MIKRILIFVVLLTTVATGQTVTLGQSFGFDYPNAVFTSAGVVRFEIKVDTGSFTSINIPPSANDVNTTPGMTTYKVAVPALTTGSHTVSFRACNVSACSVDSTPFSFNLIILPSASNVRII